MARRASRVVTPPRRGSSPNVAIVIFLVFSLLLNIVIGVFWYLEKDKTAQADKKAKDAQDNATKVGKQSELDQNYYMRKMRALLDPKSFTADELKQLRGREKEFADARKASKPIDDRHDAWFPSLVDKVESVIGKIDPNKTDEPKPDEMPSFYKVIEDKDTDIATLGTNLKEAETQAANAKAELAKHMADWNQKKFDDLFAEHLKNIEERYKVELANLKADIDLYKANYAKLKQDFDAFIQKSEDTLKAEVARHEKERDDLIRENKELKLTASVARGSGAPGDPKSAVKASDELSEPAGRIIRAEADGKTVIVDIGSNHRVVPQLTFTVHGIGAGGKPVREPKAKIEIISVLSKDQSLARVMRMYKPGTARVDDDLENEKNWLKDARDFWKIRNPIMKDDVIFNPAWSPNRRVHIALNGVFDLDGDDKDDLATLKKMLEDRGTIFDAWLELDGTNYVMRGKITEKTEWVVVGARPPFIAEKPREGEPKPDTKDDFEKMEREALSRAIEPITLRRFLGRMGFTDIVLPNKDVDRGMNGPYKEEK